MNAHDKDTTKRRARLFRNGRSQAVRIPRELEFDAEEVVIEKIGDGRLMLTQAARKKSLLEVLASLEPLAPDDRFPEITDEDLLPLDDVKL